MNAAPRKDDDDKYDDDDDDDEIEPIQDVSVFLIVIIIISCPH